MNDSVQRIDEIFWEASQLAPGDQRESFLDRACGGDRDLRQRVARLVQVQPQVEGFLERPFAGPAALGELPNRCEVPGTQIGPYKLLEQIGEGGMGLVFMAEQTRPVKRRVALKILKPGMDTRQVVARFEAERQALALMDHPNIARIHDAGATESGRPYFVMELVRGVPITEFCDQRRLTTRQRLELFITVCQAVQHAHQKGIIHRDLKPTNVLVTLHDTVAVPKVIDFGIAKATTQKLTERTMFTQFAQMVGTPLYMSPEQAEMNGLDVDTRSDVYALGVLLYELLTGTTPFESETLKKVGLDEMRRLIREDEPPTPSRRLNTLDAQVCSTVSERRGVDVRRLGQALRGELDWIVMRALEKDRNRRYESASAFAADVQRYLADEAVAACPPSAGYRLRKFARRNRRTLMTAGTVALVLVAATAVSTWQAIAANTARKLADERLDNEKKARKEAATESAVARAVNNFLQEDLLRQVNGLPRGTDAFDEVPHLTVKEALDSAAARIGKRFRDQPLVEAKIREVIGEAYVSLAQHALAVPHLERAVALRNTHLGPDASDTLAAMRSLAEAYSWTARNPDAVALYKQLLKRREATVGPDHAETLACLGDLAGAYDMGHHYDTSARLFEQLVQKQAAVCGPTHQATLTAMHGLAMAYGHMGRFAESMALHQKVLDGLRLTNGPRHESTIWPMMTFARVCQRSGDLQRAEKLLADALGQIRKHETSREARTTRSNALGWLALNMHLQHRDTEAEPLIRQTFAFHTKDHPDSPRTFYWESVLGAVLVGQQRYAEAEPHLLQGYEGIKQREATYSRGEIPIERIEAGERVVRFYEVTHQPEKARAWRDRLASLSRSQ